MINYYNNPQYIQMISVSGLFTQGNYYFYYLFMLSFKYNGTCSSHFSFSLKRTVLTKIIFINSVVMVCSCINLVHICLQTIKNNFSLIEGSCTIIKRKINTFFQNIMIQSRKLAYEIKKSSKINTTQNIFLVLSSKIHMFIFLCMFVPNINFE